MNTNKRLLKKEKIALIKKLGKSRDETGRQNETYTTVQLMQVHYIALRTIIKEW